jgi:hypothetical protein
MKSGYLNRSLEIQSLPILPENETFWEGLLGFCRKAQVSHLMINSFASQNIVIPILPGEVRRIARCEYVLELQKPGLWEGLASNHKRNIKNGRKVGLQIRRSVDVQACQEHARLVAASMERRKDRGEEVSTDTQMQAFVTFAQKGVGELFQAVLGDKVLSSILVLMAKHGGYYYSAGTSPEGMACGASHFLVHEIANTLKAQSIELFNLGGADSLNPGLERFKAGFGATIVKLEAAEFFLGSKVQKKLGTMIRLLRDRAVPFLYHMLK